MSLKERRDLHQLHRASSAGVLFTLLTVRGSSYRRAGARLFAASGGASAGTLSGGCLEADLLRRAAWYIRDGAATHTFSTAFDDTAEIPYGLGCGGEVDLLAEDASSEDAHAIMDALAATLEGHARTVVTVLPGAAQPLQRFAMDSSGDVLFVSRTLDTEDLVPLRRVALRAPHGTVHTVASRSIFVEVLQPVQRLVVFGGGDDARPLATLAHALGWRVVVADTRAQRVTAARFSNADELLVTHDASCVRAGDAVMVMTHSYQQDRHLVAQLLHAPPAFVGLLGARHRSALLLQEAAQDAGVSLASAIAAVHAPVGLELGGEGPEAIALAILAEMQAALHIQTNVTSRRMNLDETQQSLLSGAPLVRTREACAVDSAEVAQ